MAEEKKKKKTKKSKKDSKEKNIEKKQDFIKQVKIAYRALENPKKFYTTVLVPLVIMGVLVFITITMSKEMMAY